MDFGRRTPGTATPDGRSTPFGNTLPLSTLQSSASSMKRGSARSSIHPHGALASSESLGDLKADITCNWVYEEQVKRRWITSFSPGEGVVIKKNANSYACFPPTLAQIRGGFFDMVVELNVRHAITVSSEPIEVFLASCTQSQIEQDFIPLGGGLRLQVLPTLADLPGCQKHHFAAFIRDASILIVWDDDPKTMIERAETLQRNFVHLIWNAGLDDDDLDNPKKEGIILGGGAIAGGYGNGAEDPEVGNAPEKREVALISPLMVSLALALMITCFGLGGRKLAVEVMVDNYYPRLALLAVIPVTFVVGLFFFTSLIGNLFQIFGPVAAVNQNSRNYSGKAPQRLSRETSILPHVTIQMPVYKEGLNGVIRPTIISLKQAISTYEMQGGTANIFINDDGMQLISEEDAAARREFYEENNIGWVARPGHNPSGKDGQAPFLRRGKFKKASNMNYALMLSNKVEERLASVPRSDSWSQADESAAYGDALQTVLRENGRAWADGNIRVGDYILIIDSDTRVPKDCLLDAVSEMEQSPEVAILQYTSGVMQVTTSFFENGITFFTNLIYSGITFAVAHGDAPPFVGHNAVLRWTAIQDAAAYTDEDGYEKYWSESHVSEDFDMALRMQCAGYQLRFGSYTGPGFQEGVSLTVYDELARWEKYAFGCNELLFHPFKSWLFKGPFTPLFLKFLGSNIYLPRKLTILAYIGTYYSLGASWLLTLANYFLVGWYAGEYDKYYLDSFAILISVVVVFTALGNVALAVVRYRLKQKDLLKALFENFMWIPLMTVFLGGISIHISQALLCHFFSIDMVWGATAKEYEDVDFLEEMPRLLNKFKWTFIMCICLVALMVCGVYVMPPLWRIDEFSAIFPLSLMVFCHFMLPVALNPALMKFTW